VQRRAVERNQSGGAGTNSKAGRVSKNYHVKGGPLKTQIKSPPSTWRDRRA